MLLLPNEEKSLWRESYAGPLYPELTDDIEVDVVVIGAGITGLTTAYLLKQMGQKVAVIDKDTVGGGTSGRTTGKVSSQHGLVYADMVSKIGKDKAQKYGEANQVAIEQVEAIINKEQIECDWQRDDSYVYTTEQRQVQKFQREAEIAAELGLPASFEVSTPLPFETTAAIRFSEQAKFNTEKYLLGLAKAINRGGSHVFENSLVIGIQDGEPAVVRTDKAKATAKSIVVATNVPTFPLIARGGYALLEYPSESYILAGQTNQSMPGMFISPDKQHYSILPMNIDGKQQILIGGESHFWGLRGNRQARFQRLADYGATWLGLESVTHIWSDRDYIAYDNVPIIGKLYPWSENLYVGTAFKKWGLSGGTVAAMILSDAIIGHRNDWAETFNSLRPTPIKSIPTKLAHAFKG